MSKEIFMKVNNSDELVFSSVDSYEQKVISIEDLSVFKENGQEKCSNLNDQEKWLFLSEYVNIVEAESPSSCFCCDLNTTQIGLKSYKLVEFSSSVNPEEKCKFCMIYNSDDFSIYDATGNLLLTGYLSLDSKSAYAYISGSSQEDVINLWDSICTILQLRDVDIYTDPNRRCPYPNCLRVFRVIKLWDEYLNIDKADLYTRLGYKEEAGEEDEVSKDCKKVFQKMILQTLSEKAIAFDAFSDSIGLENLEKIHQVFHEIIGDENCSLKQCPHTIKDVANVFDKLLNKKFLDPECDERYHQTFHAFYKFCMLPDKDLAHKAVKLASNEALKNHKSLWENIAFDYCKKPSYEMTKYKKFDFPDNISVISHSK